MNKIKKSFSDSIKVKQEIIDRDLYSSIKDMGTLICDAIILGNKLMLCGNGGSAADAQHLTAEMLVRLKSNREGLPAITLAQDTSTLTACGNDFKFENIYKRVLETLGKKNDVLLVITTSGNSKNITSVLKSARDKGIKTLGFLGGNGGKAIDYCDIIFNVPSNNTARIQESHITAGHALIEYIEAVLLKKDFIKIQK